MAFRLLLSWKLMSKGGLELFEKFAKKMQQEFKDDPEKAKAFIRAVMGPPQRTLEGQEYEDVSLLLRLAEPFNSSNNQHTMTDEYRISGKLYHVTYFPGPHKPEINEVEED